jgi:hypothetical protein
MRKISDPGTGKQRKGRTMGMGKCLRQAMMAEVTGAM